MTTILDGIPFFGDPRAQSAGFQVDELVAIEAQIARLHARQLETLAAMAAAERDPDREWVKEDVRAALGITANDTAERLGLAEQLTGRLRASLAALKSGRISYPMARYLAEQVLLLDDATAQAVEAEVLDSVFHGSADFRRRVRRAVVSADTRDAQKRLDAARAERRVVFTPNGDGTTELWARLTDEGAAQLQARLDEAAAAAMPGDQRSAEQRRADALCEVPGAPGPAVSVGVALSTLLGLDDQAGELNGQPIPAVLARALAHDPTGTWRRILTDPAGHSLDCGRRSYRPPAGLERHVRTRDRTCMFPTCHRSAENTRRIELDHAIPWSDGGTTDADNLTALCRRHHHLRHEGGWSIRRHHDGAVEWTSPTGHAYHQPATTYLHDHTAA